MSTDSRSSDCDEIDGNSLDSDQMSEDLDNSMCSSDDQELDSDEDDQLAEEYGRPKNQQKV